MQMNPITFEVLRNSFKSICTEMNTIMYRTAFSPVITEGRDIGCCLLDRNGNLVSQGEWDLAVFVGMMEFSTKYILKKFKEIEPRDIFITNDPFVGGTHFNDVSMIKPIFYQGELVGFADACGHWSDVGGRSPGSLIQIAKEYFEEGLRIPPVKIYSKGKLNLGVQDLILLNSRLPEERKGDIRAGVCALDLAERRIKELIEKYGLKDVKTTMVEEQKYSERLLKSEIKKMEDGIYEGEDFVDMESLEKRNRKKIHVEMKIKSDKITFDFSKSDPQSESAANGTLGSTTSAIFVIVKSLFPEIPPNHGIFEPMEIIAPEGTVVNAKPPAAVSAAACTVYEKVIGAVLMAFSHVIPQKVAGCPYNLVNLTIGGKDPLRGEDFVAYLYAEGGFGGWAGSDGSDALVSLYGGGATITPVEVFERRSPILFKEWTLDTDSGGPGKYRGGLGVRKTIQLTRGTARLSAIGDREKYPPPGVFGGKFGGKQSLRLNVGTEREKNLTTRVMDYRLEAGDEFTLISGGGGGYGDPLEREVELVRRDVEDSYVSLKSAEKDYGVIIDPKSLVVDIQATKKLREKMRGKE